jgi:hypothetical protein
MIVRLASQETKQNFSEAYSVETCRFEHTLASGLKSADA